MIKISIKGVIVRNAQAAMIRMVARCSYRNIHGPNDLHTVKKMRSCAPNSTKKSAEPMKESGTKKTM
ncbi:hypothetical protein [Sphingobacterium lumbrici]|uniref:hypothetical protein n=1 Tax=Sphingobacterium lumbrici TaxID=2559600 RepID=UPI0015E3B9F6|nr:hypothetical protein [Sphingobacterium lumbrici]